MSRMPSVTIPRIAEQKARAAECVSLLKEQYPEALCALQYEGEPWRLLVMAILSAQCTDVRVNLVCETLFRRYRSAKAIADADLLSLQEIIQPCGFFRMKAKNIKGACALLVYTYNGILPQDMDALLRFPGVGRKVANLLRGDLFALPAIVADTHCIRICGRLGFYPETCRDPVHCEAVMSSLVAPEEQSDFCHRIVLFGRDRCTARSPLCEDCPLAFLCSHIQKQEK